MGNDRIKHLLNVFKNKQTNKKTLEFVQVCEPASASVLEGILVELIGMDWSPAHTPVAEVHKQSRSSMELILDELDEDMFAGPKSPLVPSKSSLSG